MKISTIIQARMSSERLKGKVLKKIGNYHMIEIMIRRLIKSKKIGNIIVATTNRQDDNKIVEVCKKNKIDVYRGSNSDALKRYYDAAKKYNVDVIIRLTADCPLIDYKVIEKMISVFKKKKTRLYIKYLSLPVYISRWFRL